MTPSEVERKKHNLKNDNSHNDFLAFAVGKNPYKSNQEFKLTATVWIDITFESPETGKALICTTSKKDLVA